MVDARNVRDGKKKVRPTFLMQVAFAFSNAYSSFRQQGVPLVRESLFVGPIRGMRAEGIYQGAALGPYKYPTW